MAKSITSINGIDLTKRIEVNSKREAWNMVNAIFPTDYAKDEFSSERAGYPVYRSTAEGHFYDYICDLNDRLEVNLSGGTTVNIWFSQIFMKARELYYENVRLNQENDDLKGELEAQKFFNDLHEKKEAELNTRIAELEAKLESIRNAFQAVIY